MVRVNCRSLWGFWPKLHRQGRVKIAITPESSDLASLYDVSPRGPWQSKWTLGRVPQVYFRGLDFLFGRNVKWRPQRRYRNEPRGRTQGPPSWADRDDGWQSDTKSDRGQSVDILQRQRVCSEPAEHWRFANQVSLLLHYRVLLCQWFARRHSIWNSESEPASLK